MIGEKWKMAIKTKSKISSPYNDRLSPKDDTSREGAIVIKALDEGFNIVLYQDSSPKNDAYSPIRWRIK